MQCDSRHQKISGADIAVARNLQSFLALVDTGGIAGVIFAAPGTTRVAFQIDAMRLLPEIFRPHSAPVFPDAVLFGRLPDGLSASSRRRAVFDCAFFLGSACGSRIEQQGVHLKSKNMGREQYANRRSPRVYLLACSVMRASRSRPSRGAEDRNRRPEQLAALQSHRRCRRA